MTTTDSNVSRELVLVPHRGGSARGKLLGLFGKAFKGRKGKGLKGSGGKGSILSRFRGKSKGNKSKKKKKDDEGEDKPSYAPTQEKPAAKQGTPNAQGPVPAKKPSWRERISKSMDERRERISKSMDERREKNLQKKDEKAQQKMIKRAIAEREKEEKILLRENERIAREERKKIPLSEQQRQRNADIISGLDLLDETDTSGDNVVLSFVMRLLVQFVSGSLIGLIMYNMLKEMERTIKDEFRVAGESGSFEYKRWRFIKLVFTTIVFAALFLSIINIVIKTYVHHNRQQVEKRQRFNEMNGLFVSENEQQLIMVEYFYNALSKTLFPDFIWMCILYVLMSCIDLALKPTMAFATAEETIASLKHHAYASYFSMIIVIVLLGIQQVKGIL